MMTTRPLNRNAIVVKENYLIGQMYKYMLSELRLIAYCLAHYDSRKEDNRSITATIEDLVEIFPMDKKYAYAVVRKAVLGINNKPLEFEKEEENVFWNWFSGFKYQQQTGTFTFRINPDIQPYLLKLKGNFTQYRLRDVYQFKAASTWKLYELLKRWAKKGEWDVELDEFRLWMGIGGKYPRWSDLLKRTIKPTIKEINNYSDLNITYSIVKKQRAVRRVIFTIKTKVSVISQHFDDTANVA